MLRKLIAAVSVLAFTVAPVAAQAAAQPAPRLDSSIEGASEDLTTTHWVLIVIGGILLVWGIIELTDDDEPASP
jgi:hypothetical protein